MEEITSSKGFLKRHLTLGSSSYDISNPTGDRWAIIIGISKYKHKITHLKYAHHDAEELYDLIRRPSGGGFEKSHILKLINEEATTANVTKALRSFLKKPAKDDLVLIYFACHGDYDLDRPKNVYLLTYDTDPDDISGTALPMREIDDSLKDNLLSEKVVIIADACHSASIGKGIGTRNTTDSTAVVNRYLENLSKANRGVALLTSAEANEVAFEDERWGGGHGAFTYFLLEGMRGNADISPQDGIVTVGELFEYVRENVQKATGNLQHPSVGTSNYDRNLPMAITGGITAQEYFRLGCHLFDLGLMLDDNRRLDSANKQFYEAIRLSKLDSNPFPECNIQLGKSLMKTDNNVEAIEVFRQGIDDVKKYSKVARIPSEVYLYMGMAYAKIRNYSDAIESLNIFLRQSDNDDNADWIRKYVELLKHPNEDLNLRTGKKYALLIGIQDFSSLSIPGLEGPMNDVQIIKEMLIQKFEFDESNIIVLTDKNKTTYESIIREFNHLTSIIKSFDTVLIYYTGHGFIKNEVGYLIPSNFDVKSWKNAITYLELHYLVSQLHSTATVLVIDAKIDQIILSLSAKSRTYTLLTSSSPGEEVRESLFDGKRHGDFTYYFVKGIYSSNSTDITYGEVIDFIVNSKTENKNLHKTPLLIGNNKEDIIFSRQDYYILLFDFAQSKNFSLYSSKKLQKLYCNLKDNIGPSFVSAYYAFGLAFLENTEYDQAHEALQVAVFKNNVQHPNMLYALAISELRTGHNIEAVSSLRQYMQLTSPNNTLKEIIEKSRLAIGAQKYALLIGIDNYINPQIEKIKGAINDVLALKKLLVEKFDFKEENITVILNEQATYNSIIKSFDHLVEQSQKAPSLFYFAGNGSVTRSTNLESLRPTIVSADGRLDGVYDIDLSELSSRSSQKNGNLITIIDAGWTINGGRTIESDVQNRITSRRIISTSYGFNELTLKIGAISIYPNSIEIASSLEPISNEKEFTSFEAPDKKEYHGVLTHALIEELIKISDTDNITYSQLSKALSEVRPKIVGNELEAKLFSNSVLKEVIESLVKMEKCQLIDKIIILIQRLIEQRNNTYPEGYLNLGIAYAARGDLNKSINYIEKAIAQKDNFYPEASYYLGRFIFESGKQFARAVGLLREATIDEPNNIAAYYYLGQAIRSLIEKETLVEADQAIKTYLKKGAPLGLIGPDELSKINS